MQGRAGGLWTDATLEMGGMHGQMSSKDDVGAPYTGHPGKMSLCQCAPFCVPHVTAEGEKRGSLYFFELYIQVLTYI